MVENITVNDRMVTIDTSIAKCPSHQEVLRLPASGVEAKHHANETSAKDGHLLQTYMYKLRTYHKHPEGRIFAWMALILAGGMGLLSPILPNFIKSIMHTDSATSIFYSLMSIVTLIGATTSVIVFKKFQRTKIAKFGFIMLAVIYFLLVFVSKFIELTIIIAAKTWLQVLLVITIALFIRDFAKSKNLGAEEGKHFKFQNIGAMIGMFLGGFLATKFSYEFIFVIAAAVLVVGFIYFYHEHAIKKHPAIINATKVDSQRFLNNIKRFFSDKERAKAYLISLSMMSWMCFKYLYIPLYIVSSGYLESMAGLVLSMSIIPLIFLEIKVGDYADKKGIQLPISSGFLIVGILLLLIFFSPYPLLNFALVILASFGTALIEPLSETLLFKHLPKEEEDDLYGVFMTADPVASFIIPLIGAAILFFLPFKSLFAVFAGLMFIVSLYTWISLKPKS
ncbi:MAG: MFS transporter [Patescibacteria group bacterium]